MNDNISVTIPEDAWQDMNAGEDGEAPRLLATLTINEIDFHVEAIAVEVIDGHQKALNSAEDEDLGDIHRAASADGHFDTVSIQGRDYVLFATPYC